MHRKGGWGRIAGALLGAALVVGAARAADDPRIAELEQKIRELSRQVAALSAGADDAKIAELSRRIEILAKEVEGLKLGEAGAETSAGVYGLGPSASKIYGAKRGVAFGGYGEMLYSRPAASLEDDSPSGAASQIDLLRAVLYFGAKFNDTILFNSEIEFEHVTTGEGDEERGEVTVEFAYVDFLVSKGINARAGLLLVPMGFINERHEPPTYFGTRRPLVEQTILPTTWSEDGAGVFGDLGTRVSYRAYLTSGLAAAAGTSSGAEGFSAEGIRDGRSKGAQASAERLALTGRIDGTVLDGLTVGGAFFTGDAGQGLAFAGGTLDARTTVADLHAEYRWRGLTARALYARTSIDDAEDVNLAQGLVGSASVGSRQYGWYGEAGYDVLAHAADARQSLSPYVRYERLNTQHRVPAGFAADPANDATLLTSGIMWKPIPNISVKLDWNRATNEARTGLSEVNASLGFMF
ncbi:MAG TPA: hypothetical protein VFB67_07535 [Candidatus Polarisedimenticolaceae bacterium]|nr:hypothetical protein [Candidatus Polarisedimenticolaceae bacterium]